MDVKKVLNYAKTHKKEIITGTAIIAGGIVLYAFTKQKPKIDNIITFEELKSMDMPEDWKLGTLDEYFKEDGFVQAIVNDIKVGDIGELGEEFIRTGGVTADDTVSAVLYIS